MSDLNTIELAAELTIAWLGNPSTRASADEVDAFLTSMNDTLRGMTSAPAREPDVASIDPEYTPAVSVRKSLESGNYIISMIDGRPYKSLKRHLSAKGLAPDEYRARYNLKADYPMVAPAYSESRREAAKRLGLGRKRAGAAQPASESAMTSADPAMSVEPSAAPERKRRARKGATDRTVGASDAVQEHADAAPAPRLRVRKSLVEAKTAAKTPSDS